jgi:hypothetical protein
MLSLNGLQPFPAQQPGLIKLLGHVMLAVADLGIFSIRSPIK